MENQQVDIDYTNHRGERSIRRIIPIRIAFTTSQWHEGEQYFCIAWDVEKKADRYFAMEQIHSWKGVHDGQAQKRQGEAGS
jgi:predicted DNA-binding transcriptional regulator YafY